MATLQFTVFHNASATAQGPVLNEDVLTISGTAAQSGVLHSTASPANQARRVRIATDTDCWVTWGESPTALNDGTEGRMLFANSWEYVEIRADHKISVIERV